MNSRSFDALIHAYSMRECTLIRCVNTRLYKASISTCTKCEVMSEESEDLEFLNHVISRDQNISCNFNRAAIKIHITHFTRIFNDHLIL